MAPKVGGKVYIVEHLDPELGPWSELEYIAIAQEAHESGSSFTLSSVAPDFKVPEALKAVPVFKATQTSVENIYAATKSTVCLLDPSADKDLSPEDAQEFGTFLFGGILGMLGRSHAYGGSDIFKGSSWLRLVQATTLQEVTFDITKRPW